MSYLTVIRSHDRKVAMNYYYYYYYLSKATDPLDSIVAVINSKLRRRLHSK